MSGGNGGARAWELLRQEAKATGQDVQALATDYVIERLMERLSAVDEDGVVAIKGGQSLGLLLSDRLRPTKDLDINVDGRSQDDPEIAERAIALVALACSIQRDDGVHFDVSGIDVERRKHQGEGGLRLTIPAGVHTSRVPFVIDVGIGNEMTFEPSSVSSSGVLGGRKAAPAPIEVLVYPLENTLAEKLVAKIEDGSASIRHKDFFDLWMLFEIAKRIGDLSLLSVSTESLSPEESERVLAVRDSIRTGTLFDLPEIGIDDGCLDRLGLALRRTAAHRAAAIPDDVEAYLESEFARDSIQPIQWANWCRNNLARLRYAPPGTERGGDRDRSLARLFQDLAPFLESVAARARFPDAVASPVR